MGEFWPTWISFWFATVGVLVSLHVAFAQGGTGNFFEEKPITHLAARSAFLSYVLVDRVFGRRLFSLRAIFASALLSSAFFVGSFSIAMLTTPGIWRFVLLYFNHDEPPGDLPHYEAMLKITSLALVLSSMIAEFFFVLKSRAILRTLKFESSIIELVYKITLDVTTTLAMFIVTTPITILVALVLLNNLNPGLDLSHVFIEEPGGRFIRPGALEIDVSDLLGAYTGIVSVLFSQVLSHVREIFSGYHFLFVLPTVRMNGAASLLRAEHFDPQTAQLTIGFLYPVTTMLATAFSTTIWVAVSASLLIASRSLCHTFIFARNSLQYLQAHPHVLFWLGVVPSITIFVVGGLIHLIS